MYSNKSHYRKSWFSDRYEIFSDYVTNHDKIFGLYLVKNDFELFFDGEFYPHKKLNDEVINQNCISKNVLLLWIECIIERGHKFSHPYEMNATSGRNKNELWILY